MKRFIPYKIVSSTCALAVIMSFGAVTVASAVTNATTTANNKNLQTLITKADTRITSRIAKLDALTAKLSATTKLSATNRATLLTEITQNKTNLTALKSKVDADTTVAAATADNKSIFTDYRIYGLLIPKDDMIVVTDGQLTQQASLQFVAGLLNVLVRGSTNNATLTPKLADATAKLSASQTLSQAAQTKLLSIKVSDFNSDPKTLTSVHANLATARSNDKTAYQELQAVSSALGIATAN